MSYAPALPPPPPLFRDGVAGGDTPVLRPPRSGGEIGWGGDPGGSVPGGTSGFPVPTAKLGLWVFLAILTVVFTIIIAAYKERMALDDWQAMPDPGLLWVNSGVLLLSCVAMQYAKLRARVGDQRRIWQGLIAGGALAWLFLAGQLWVWHQLSSSGFLVTSNPANSFFYMITGLHGLHLIGGIIVGGIVVHKHWRRSAYARVGLTVDLCAQYWHFLLLVWMAMFVLMLNT